MSEVEVPYDYTDKEIKNYIEERYSTGKIESIMGSFCIRKEAEIKPTSQIIESLKFKKFFYTKKQWEFT